MKYTILILLSVIIFSCDSKSQTAIEKHRIEQSQKHLKADKVIELSDKISIYLGAINGYEDEEFAYRELKRYDIVVEMRSFKNHGWTMLYEIVPKGRESIGWSNTPNPEWIEVGGTTTINLPPKGMIDDVLYQLKEKFGEKTIVNPKIEGRATISKKLIKLK